MLEYSFYSVFSVYLDPQAIPSEFKALLNTSPAAFSSAETMKKPYLNKKENNSPPWKRKN